MAYKTYNGIRLFSYDDSIDQPVQRQNSQPQQNSNPLGSFFNWIGDTAGAIGNTVKDTVGAVGSFFATDAANKTRENVVKANQEKLDNIAKKYGFNSYNEISDDAWENNKEMKEELKKASSENTKSLKDLGDAYKNNWAVKNTANVKQGDYGANAIKTWNTLADVLTAPVSMPASIALNAGQGYLSALGDELQGKDVVADPLGNGQAVNSSVNWGNVGKQGTANALAGAAGGATGGVTGKIGGKLAGSNNILGKTAGKILNSGIGRGAISGAAGGATGAGAATAFEGGDLGQVLANAATGAQQGAGQGAVMSGAMSLGNKAVNRVKNVADNAYSRIVNKNAVDRLATGIEQGADGNIKFARMKQDVFDDINSIRVQNGLEPLTKRQVTAYKNAVNNNLGNRVNEGLTPKEVAQIAFNSLTSESARAIPGYYENQVAISRPGMKNDYDSSVIGLAEDGGTSIKSIEPRTRNQVELFENNGQQKIGPKSQSGFSLASENQLTSKSSIAQEGTDVNRNINNLERPTGWSGDELTIKKKNIFNKMGDAFEDTGTRIKESEVYNKLHSKTANEVQKNGSIKKLRDLGYGPDNYKDVGAVSETTNKFIRDVIPEDIKVRDTALQKNLLNLDDIDGVIESDKMLKKFESQISKSVENSRSNNPNSMDEYNAKKLFAESERLMDLSANARRKSLNVNGTAQSSDYDTLADAYARASRMLRAKVDDNVQWGDKFDKNILSNRLKNLGATEEDIKYLTEANSLSDLKKRTSVYEQGRQMWKEMETSKTRRNAISGSSSTNPINVAAQEAGVNDILKTAVRPIKTISSGLTTGLGKALNKVGDVASGVSNSKVGQAIGSIANAATTQADLPYALIGRLSGTEEGREAAANPQTYANPTNLEQQLGNSAIMTGDTGYAGTTNVGVGNYGNGMPTSSYGGGYSGTGNNMLDRIVGGMENAFNAGDVAAFSQLADIYNTLSKVYGVTSGSSTGSQKLSATQQRANAAMNSLQRLSGMTPDLGYNLSGIPVVGDIATLGGNAYEGEAKSLAQQIGYMVSGSNIKAEEAEAIGKAYVPQPFDSEYTRQLKLQRAAEIIQQYQNGIADDTANIAYAY